MNDIDPTYVRIAAAAIGYLFGSIPWGLVIVKMVGLGDIRQMGSGNIGATNVLRTGRKGLAILTLILDVSKGAVVALAFMQYGVLSGILAGFAAVLGHNFTVWLGFKGGKGVATTLGVILAVSWPVGILTCCVWLVVWSTFKYSSLASMGALVASPFIAHWFHRGPTAIMWMCVALAVLSIVRHRTNIVRLIKGEEPKSGVRNKLRAAKDDDTPPQS